MNKETEVKKIKVTFEFTKTVSATGIKITGTMDVTDEEQTGISLPELGGLIQYHIYRTILDNRNNT